MEPWWEFIVENEQTLRRLCVRQCRGRYDLVDDMYSACCVARAQAIYATYDPAHESGASLKHHMFTSMKLYMFKFINTLGRKYCERFDVPLSEDYDKESPDSNGSDLELKDWVEEIMDRLEPHHTDIIKMYHWEGLIHREIAARLGFSSKGAGRSRYLAAMARIREIIDDMD